MPKEQIEVAVYILRGRTPATLTFGPMAKRQPGTLELMVKHDGDKEISVPAYDIDLDGYIHVHLTEWHTFRPGILTVTLPYYHMVRMYYVMDPDKYDEMEAG